MEQLTEGTTFQNRRLPEGSIKIQMMAHRRVAIRKFAERSGAFWAEVEDVCEGPIPNAPELIQKAIERFERHVVANDVKGMPHVRIGFSQIRDPGRVADAIAPHLRIPINEKQRILGTNDPIARLETVIAILE